ncbi:MAG: Orotate phosphoribosyltransferase [bacterium]|nr:Orotate phosphoribosyltransferase [bacterium]
MGSLTALRDLIQQQALLAGQFTLKSGAISPYYFDLRRVTLAATGARLIGQALWEHCRQTSADAVAGPATAAIPLITATLVAAAEAHAGDFRGGYVRSEAKGHGTGQRLEGPIQPGDRVLLVEDTVTSGGSLLDTAAVLQEAGCTIVGAVWLVDRGAGGLDAVRQAGIAATSLFTLEDFDLPTA